jgi:hypothetical protein
MGKIMYILDGINGRIDNGVKNYDSGFIPLDASPYLPKLR